MAETLMRLHEARERRVKAESVEPLVEIIPDLESGVVRLARVLGRLRRIDKVSLASKQDVFDCHAMLHDHLSALQRIVGDMGKIAGRMS